MMVMSVWTDPEMPAHYIVVTFPGDIQKKTQ
jgi:hypothetical protein